MSEVVYVSATGQKLYAGDIELLLQSEAPRLPTMQTTTDVLPLFLLAMTDLAKTITKLLEIEIANS